MLSWWSCQSPVAQSCSLLNHPNHFRGGMFMLNAKFDGDLLIYSLSHFECDGHTVHMLTQRSLPPHWLIQWSCHCSHMRIPVHCHWLPGYIGVMQTILIILSMAGLFPDRPHICKFWFVFNKKMVYQAIIFYCCFFFYLLITIYKPWHQVDLKFLYLPLFSCNVMSFTRVCCSVLEVSYGAIWIAKCLNHLYSAYLIQ